MSVYALIMAAGDGKRMGLGVNKAMIPLRGVPMVRRTVEVFAGFVDGVVIVTRGEDIGAMRALMLDTVAHDGDIDSMCALSFDRRTHGEDIGAMRALMLDMVAYDRDIDSMCVLSSDKRTRGENVDSMRASSSTKMTQSEKINTKYAPPSTITVVEGGKTRQQSVLRGLTALPADAEYVLVHDAARPFVSADVIQNCIESVKKHGNGVASVPLCDTIKQVKQDHDKYIVIQTPPRNNLRAAQTPQAFPVTALKRAIEALEALGETASDDASAMEAAGHRVALVEGSEENRKITTPLDLEWAEWYLSKCETAKNKSQIAPSMPRKNAKYKITPQRVGIGYDVHRLVEGRPLILCGVLIPYEKGLLGHSDADVALHALMDAMLGAAAMGDIGAHFSDRDPAYQNAASTDLLRKVAQMTREKGFFMQQADITIVAEKPRLSPYISDMRARVAEILSVALEKISVKATTTEGLGFEGKGKGISAQAVVSVLDMNTLE